MSNPIGIMQGRLSPSLGREQQYFPSETWEPEYGLAAELGFDSIEWLVDLKSFNTNPILDCSGRKLIKNTQSRFNVLNLTVCADIFKEKSLVSGKGQVIESNVEILDKLIIASADIGAKCLIIPLIENASLNGSHESHTVNDALKPSLESASKKGINIAIESDLPAALLKEWISNINHPSIGINYDLGNAASYGYSVDQEILTLGSSIYGVHVKDRKIAGPNVPLGQGEVNFESALKALRKAAYTGPLVLETFRDRSYMSYAAENMRFLLTQLNKLNRRSRSYD